MKKTWEKVRAVLVKRRYALRQALAGDEVEMGLTETVGDEGDAALESETNDASSQLAQVESRELAHIEHALTKLSDGSYGKCEGCGKSIAAARLQALPYAVCCIQCARLDEQSGRESSIDRMAMMNLID